MSADVWLVVCLTVVLVPAVGTVALLAWEVVRDRRLAAERRRRRRALVALARAARRAR